MRTLKEAEIDYLIHASSLELARRDFWEFCKLTSPDFYTEDRTHLFNLATILHRIYKGELLREDGKPFKKLMINMPPQHGKSRTLIKFCQWILGNDNDERIISCSYNDDAAHDFSRYTRDGIQEEKLQEEIVYSDIFNGTKIKRGDSAYDKWALEGQHFNYLGAGIGGSITGKGGTVLIVDDPVKSAEIALNENALEKIWIWYTGTFLSRVSAKDGEPIEIIVMTRWSKNDLCGKLLSSEKASDWYVLSMKAYDEENEKMLCPTLLNRNRYESLKTLMLPEIFLANYNQEPIDIRGRLYQSFKTYRELPCDDKGEILLESIRNYTDTADEGNDYLCSICYGIYQGEAYILDVVYTKDAMEITEPQIARMLFENNVKEALIESNNGGRGFARAVERLIWEIFRTKKVTIKWFHQNQNKLARILSNSTFVMNKIYFPHNWNDKWPEYYKAMITFQKEGKNKNDDAPDATTGIAESLSVSKKLKAVISPY